MRNPKQEGSNVYDCIPQSGPCPIGCNQCFYNRPGAFYCDIQEPQIPEVPAGAIVRMNSGNDSNLHKGLVLDTASQYSEVFFNTSIPRFEFPGPVVLTTNPKEDDEPELPEWPVPQNLMFVRLRVSPSNGYWVRPAIERWTLYQVPVVLTFMRYYDQEPPVCKGWFWPEGKPTHEFKKHIVNSYWCPTEEFMRAVREEFASNRLVSLCGGYESSLCKDCRNCETYYWQTKKRMQETKGAGSEGPIQ